VPAAIEHAHSIRQQPIMDVFQVLSGEQEYNYDDQAEYQMKSPHANLVGGPTG